MDVPEPPETPPQGLYQKVDASALAERAADKAHDAKKIALHADNRSQEAFHLARKHADMIERIPAIETLLIVALRPTVTPTYVRSAVVLGAAAAFVTAVAAAALVILVARAPGARAVVNVDTPGTQAINRSAPP